jgi:hypothetical protein
MAGSGNSEADRKPAVSGTKKACFFWREKMTDKINEIIWLEKDGIPNATLGISADGEIFVPDWCCDINKDVVFLCAAHDGIPMAVLEEQVYYPMSWMITEFGVDKKMCEKLKDAACAILKSEYLSLAELVEKKHAFSGGKK